MSGRALHNKILSILVSLLLSFFLWLALAGQDTSTTELSVPLELANLPSDLAIRSEVPTTITFQVLANTAQLRFLADRKLHVWINAASAREGYNAFSVDADSLDLPRGVQVRKITPPVIEFEAVKTTNKVVSLRPDATGQVHKDYRVRALILEPDEVTLQGPQEVLTEIESLSTTPIQLTDLQKDTTLTVTPLLSDLPPGIVVTPREIKAIITLEERRLEETFTDLPIEAVSKNGRASNLKLVPDKVEVSVSWPSSRPRAITASDIKIQVTVDEDELRQNGSLTLPLVAVAPSGVAVTGIKPGSVNVLRQEVNNNTPPLQQPSATVPLSAAP